SSPYYQATITTPNADWNGADTITFTATDPGGLSDNDDAVFEVTAVNDAPVVSDISGETIAEGGSFATITLDDYVADPDNADDEMTWSATGGTDVSVSIDGGTHVATVTYTGGWSGSETITFTATDPGGLSDSDDAVFEVTSVNDAPVVDDIPNQTIAEGGSFTDINLDDYVADPDNADDEMTWSYSGNSDLTVDIVDRVATITYPAGWNGSEMIIFTAEDPGGLTDSDDAVFKVTMVTGDTIAVATVPGVPGSKVTVPVNFTNSCDLAEIVTNLEWTSDYLFLDSASWTDSRVEAFLYKYDTINPVMETAFVGAADSSDMAAPGYGNFVNLHFTLAPETPSGVYDIEIDSSAFVLNCGTEFSDVFPEEINGGVVVDTSAGFTCGYVVDTAGNPVPNVTVELYNEFPVGSYEKITTANASGAFTFSDISTFPFDLWAYHEGYYPGLVENITYGESGIMIVLTPVEEVTTTPEWVNFYCDNNLYFDEPLPIGSVIDAYDPDGIHCGSYYVTELGRYGFLPVYRDDEYTPEDDGADPDDIIRFFVNGFEAETDVEPVWTANGDSWQVCLDAGEITKTCDLLAGWNLVSWSVDQEEDYIVDALSSLGDTLEVVMGFEQGALTYDPDLPQFSTLWYV
ncbi:MAG: Ig-like domain-containing protein, partial [Thermodesulfobacteriota bacterium]|nr:Ig-like domain-containing protein [Thermodesulfobacteriota bacterium]